MFSSLFSSSGQPGSGQNSALPSFGALPSAPNSAPGQPSQQDLQAVCVGVQQRMQAIQSMHSASFLTYSYVLADSPNQIQQVYNSQFQQQVHHDAGKWHEAKVRNPDSQFAYPLPVYGFSALSDRSKQQRAHVNNLAGAADNAKTQISNLKAHTERIILTELNNCEKRNKQLSMQLAKLMLSIELFGLQNCKASVDFTKHRELLEKLEKVSVALGLLQKRIVQIQRAQKSIEAAAAASQLATSSAAVAPVSGPFLTLKESVSKKVDSVYNAVLDRCRAVSAQAMHDRLNSRSHDYLAELKRQYIAGEGAPSSVISPVKFRTMNSFELAITKLLSGVSTDIFGAVLEVSNMASSPPLLGDLWQVVAHVSSAPSATAQEYLHASIAFLETKFASEVTGSSSGMGRVSKQIDKKSALYSYCRQRISIRTGDTSWIWFAVFCAFRAGWAAVLSEIGAEKGPYVEGVELVCGILAKVVEGVPHDATDSTRLSSIVDPSGSSMVEDVNASYKRILVTICKNEFDQVSIAQQLPDCNAFDWIWFGLRTVVASKTEFTNKLGELRRKIDSLPLNYFSQEVERKGLYPSLSDALSVPSQQGGTTGIVHKVRTAHAESTKSAVQLALMHFITLDFDKGIDTALKARNEEFDINDPFHRAALYISMCLDRFGVLHAIEANGLKGSFDASGIVIEAALTIAVIQERNHYATAVASGTGKKVAEQLALLDKRRESTITRQ